MNMGYLLAQRRHLLRMLADMSPDDVLGRLSIQNRLEAIEEEMSGEISTMSLTEYADWTEDMWLSKGDAQTGITERDRTIATMGLAGEVGEVMEILKKRIRDGHFDREQFTKEMGDVLYYWARLCRMYDIEPQEVLMANVNKIESRRARGTMRGSGNDR